MIRTSVGLWSTTAIAAALVATPAYAQEQVVPPNPNATAQQNPADPQPNADAPQSPAAAAGASDNAIVVTGLRRALQSARNVKKNSDQILDAIVASDIGKLPDIAVSDTAARIPGIQVTRERGEANRVLLRGLDNAYYTTTYNSRDIFTAEARSVALQDFPSGAIAALEAFKTSSANLIEPGIAGLVNVRSRRPFDFKGFEINGSVWALHPRQSNDWTPNGNILITDRWRLGDGEMGALLNFSYTKLHYLDSIIENAYFVAPGPEGGRLPDWPKIEYDEATRTRPSLNGALQWRPSPDLELYAEGLWQGFRHEIQDRHFEQPIWGGQTYTNIVFQPGTNLIQSGTVFNPRRGEGWQGGTFNKTDTYQFAVGGRWDHGPLRVTGDVARTDSTFTGSTESVDYVLCGDAFNCGQTVNFTIGAPGDIPSFELVNFNASDPANFSYRGLFEEAQQAKGSDWQGRLDFEYSLQNSLIPKIQWGVRYVSRDASRVYGSRYNDSQRGSPLSEVPLDYQLFDAGFKGADNPPSPVAWLSPTYESIRNNISMLRLYSGYPSGDPPAYDPLASFTGNEKSLAGYAQLNYEFGIVDGQIGVRAVHADRQLHGTRRIAGVNEPVDPSSKETYWLPNISARVKFSPELQLRLAATKTRTRPQFNDLSPSITIGQPPNGCDPTVQVCQTPGRGGNPDLRDLRSTNYDASLEYYFSRTGFASVAAFDHELNGFVTPSSFTLTGIEAGGFPVRVYAPTNSGDGHVRGFEAQINTFFDFEGLPEWLHSFGVQANVTHVDASAKYPRPVCPTVVAGQDPPPCGDDPNAILGGGRVLTSDPNDLIDRPLLFVSKWSYNIIGMFERGPASVRLAYNKRSPYWGDWSEHADFSSGGQPYVLRQRVHEPGRLDLSASYNFMDRFTVFGDWTNILSRPQKTDLIRIDPSGSHFDPNGDTVGFALRARYTERILSLGVRFRFGGVAPAVAAPPAPYIAPPPPPPPPVVEPAPPPPPPPAPVERGERGN